MFNISDVVFISYPPGYFGHYFHWVLNNFTLDGEHNNINLPFDTNGGSHSTRHGNINVLETSFKSKFQIFHTLKNNTEVINTVKNNKCVVIEHNKNAQLQAINMQFTKGAKGNISRFSRAAIKECNLSELATISEYREFCSYKLFNEIEWVSAYEFNNAFSIELNDLLYNFEEVLTNLVSYLGTSLVEPMEVIIANHNVMMNKQKFLNHDEKIQSFLTAFKNNEELLLPKNATIIDEAYIQHYLRDNMNLEIKCFELEEFPKTTTELHKITYPAEEIQRLE